jgi:phosphatidylserine decarboxylase
MDPILLYCRGLLFWLPALGLALIALPALGLEAAVPLFALAVLMRWLFRRPSPSVPPDPLGLLSPADGRVIGIDHILDPYLERECTRVTIHMPRLGPYTTRGPTEGKVLESQRLEDLGGEISGHGTASGRVGWIETDEGDRVGMVFYRRGGLVRPVCVLHVGERVGQGQACGCIPFGGRVDLLLPLEAKVKVPVGQSVRGGVDALAALRHPSAD